MPDCFSVGYENPTMPAHTLSRKGFIGKSSEKLHQEVSRKASSESLQKSFIRKSPEKASSGRGTS
jgi:hypothetical protein